MWRHRLDRPGPKYPGSSGHRTGKRSNASSGSGWSWLEPKRPRGTGSPALSDYRPCRCSSAHGAPFRPSTDLQWWYNFRSLRRRLEGLGHSFRLDSDTEVLAAACAQWGPDAVNELEGMYAFVVDDPNRDLVWAARDPLGQKPLYVCDERFFPDAKWFFVSELKAVIPEAKLSLNRLAAIRFLAYDFVPDDDGIMRESKASARRTLVHSAVETRSAETSTLLFRCIRMKSSITNRLTLNP